MYYLNKKAIIQDENGIITITLIATLLIVSIIALGAMMTIFQVLKVTAASDSHMTALQQVQNAGFWISRDAQMSDNITTDDLSGTDFLVISWSEVDSTDNTTVHTATYFLDNVSGNIGNLKRNHTSSAGVINETLIAQYISFDPSDPVNTSNVCYSSPSLTFKLKSIFKEASETREYTVSLRPHL